MKITDLLKRESIAIECKVQNKKEALDMAAELMQNSGNINSMEEYLEAVYKREEEGTTGIGDGIAIPHGKSSAVKNTGISAMVLSEGIEFEALDDRPVSLLFLIAVPDTEDNIHLEVLSRLAVLLMKENVTERLKSAATADEFLKIIDEAENEGMSEKKEQKCNSMKILAVTGCPTGIAHTYMAAESIEKVAEKKGYKVKVETRGQTGTENMLTSEDIEEADGIIIAADTHIPLERFSGKKVIFCSVSDGISRADRLIEKLENGDVPVYKSDKVSEAQKTQNKLKTDAGEKFSWHTIYKHLMNGVSHMLPFVVGGGILMAMAFLIDGFFADISALEDKSQFGTITESAAFFKRIGQYAFDFMLPVLAGYIAASIGDRPALAPGFVGGYIAFAGKSGFLGALVIGFVAGYVMLLLRKVCKYFPEKLEGIKPVLIYPLMGILIIGTLMIFVIEPSVGVLNTALNNGLDSMNGAGKVMLGIVLGGMMSVDFGGPVNKAAYVFGTASIAAGNYDIMAAVMVSGMVAPCAIALATLVFGNKFTEEERKAGPVNFIMGLSFISEGAIPYAAADPLRVLPACMTGSALAGAMSMLFKCKLMAPHGGIFVFPIVENPFMYLAALMMGIGLATILLGLLKQRKEV